jgi:hypothetical protein
MNDKIYKFHRVIPEKNYDAWEDVNIDDHLWQWEAEYHDGTKITQFDNATPLPEFGDNVFLFRQTKDIDQSQMKHFKAVSPRLAQEHVIIWNKRWKLIARYITADLVMKIYYDKKHFGKTGEKVIKQVERRVYRAFAYGYENKVGGIVVKNINVIMPNHEVVTTDDLSNIKFNAIPLEEYID